MLFRYVGLSTLIVLFFLFANISIAATTAHIYDPYGNLIATITSDETLSNTNFIHTDHLGSIQSVSDEEGNLVELSSYYPFGAERINATTGIKPEQRKFTGHEYDVDSDLTYANARYYNQDSGQFLSQDQIAQVAPTTLLSDPQQQNTYSYARNNPTNLYDPTGLLTMVVPGTWNKSEDWSNGGNATTFLSSVESTFGEAPQIVNWSGGDNKKERLIAAKYITKTINSHHFVEGEKLNIIGHSHGGNIGILVSQMSNRKIDNLVTLGTPVRSDYKPNTSNIGNHMNVYSNLDPIQVSGGGGLSVSSLIGHALPGKFTTNVGNSLGYGEFGRAGRKFGSAKNINATKKAGFSPLNTHSNLWQNSSVWAKIDSSF